MLYNPRRKFLQMAMTIYEVNIVGCKVSKTFDLRFKTLDLRF
jgi:uncharacterized protein (DUF1919 family)